MRDLLLKIGNVLELKNLEKFDDEQLSNLILQHITKRLILEKSLFQLSEDFSCGAELSIRIMSSINRIIDRIYTEKDIYSFISYCFDEFIKLLPAENISFMEKHPEWNWLILKVASGKIKLKDFKSKLFNINNTLAGEVFKEGNFIYIPDITKDKKYNSKLSTLVSIRSVLAVPVKIQNKIIGVINFSHPEVNAFDEFCIFFFVSMVQLFSAIITLFKLYHENSTFNEQLQKEVNRKTLELQKINKKLYKASITDSLTGIYNRRFFFQRLEEEYARTLRYGNSFCLILFDLDNLKKINDTFGHPEGDRLIKLFAKILKTNKRKEDIAARIGGDEFGCIFIGASLEGAKKTAERIKEELKKRYKKAPVSVSGALCCIGKGELFKFYKNYKDFFKELDKGLFKAKKIRDTIEIIETK
ncbi:sensor domain-containing diguanylate cyclase [Thermodesulfovibrio yellowstonii]|uniref:diguanylate cyclase n=1 Tax=Thermodesulfovibrio yellowstonii (strain ATCC 51303 / DSM 11347 / YP87) TaxID=289376 RepID=B5YGD8_THEYD|nr:diguanylate cyclase [Thermodesulfovibrio yellowstonii]ACI20210.1 sensory box/ggdef domain protein [Thermodesulfovibrio yellowstonii DSM 11347]